MLVGNRRRDLPVVARVGHPLERLAVDRCFCRNEPRCQASLVWSFGRHSHRQVASAPRLIQRRGAEAASEAPT